MQAGPEGRLRLNADSIRNAERIGGTDSIRIAERICGRSRSHSRDHTQVEARAASKCRLRQSRLPSASSLTSSAP